MAGYVAVASAEGHHLPHLRFPVHVPVAVGRAQDSSQGLRIAQSFLRGTHSSQSLTLPALPPSNYHRLCLCLLPSASSFHLSLFSYLSDLISKFWSILKTIPVV